MRKLMMAVAVACVWIGAAPCLHAQAAFPGTTANTNRDNNASIDQDVSLLRQDLRSKKKQ
jgi:hypothetical protein